MTRQLNEQSYCSWCGAKVTYNTEWSSECPQCGYKNYINPRPCCNAIITKGKAVLMIRRATDPQKGKFDFPGGFMDMTDASMEDATYREVHEELGMPKESLSQPTYMGSDTTWYEWMSSMLYGACFFYLFELVSPAQEIKLDVKENSEFAWYSEDDFKSIDFAWEIDKKMFLKYYRSNK